MDWTQAFTIIGIIAGFFVFMMNRMDSNQKQTAEDFKQVNEKIDANQKQMNARIDSIQKQMNEHFNNLENRMTSLESDIKHTNQRLTDFQMQVNQRFNTLENYVLPKKFIQEEVKEN